MNPTHGITRSKPRFLRPEPYGAATSEILYPTVKEIIEANRRVLEEIRVHRADRHGVLMGKVGEEKVRSAIEEARSADGDACKAAALLISLVKGHPFESGTGGPPTQQPLISSSPTASP